MREVNGKEGVGVGSSDVLRDDDVFVDFSSFNFLHPHLNFPLPSLSYCDFILPEKRE